MCDACKDEPATKYCGDCKRNSYFCEGCCTFLHSRAANSAHNSLRLTAPLVRLESATRLSQSVTPSLQSTAAQLVAASADSGGSGDATREGGGGSDGSGGGSGGGPGIEPSADGSFASVVHPTSGLELRAEIATLRIALATAEQAIVLAGESEPTIRAGFEQAIPYVAFSGVS
jgi:hypothetical protein